MIGCWDVYSAVRKLKISDARAEEIDKIACKYMTPNREIEEKIQEAIAEKEDVQEKKLLKKEKVMMSFWMFLKEKIVQIVLLMFAVVTIEIFLMIYSFDSFIFQ